MIYKCLIADDEMPARELVAAYIEQIPYLTVVNACENGIQVLQAIKEQEPDILFLDIQMPNLKGTEVAGLMQDDGPVFIFTTAYEEYALNAFELQAVDYLLKPFSLERFVQAADRAIGRLQARTNGSNDQTIDDFIMVKSEHKLLRVNFTELLYVEAFREYVRLVLLDRQILTLDTMKNMEATLPDGRFCRTHKSYIAAIDKVSALYGNQLEIGEVKIPIGRSYRARVLERLKQKSNDD